MHHNNPAQGRGVGPHVVIVLSSHPTHSSSIMHHVIEASTLSPLFFGCFVHACTNPSQTDHPHASNPSKQAATSLTQMMPRRPRPPLPPLRARSALASPCLPLPLLLLLLLAAAGPREAWAWTGPARAAGGRTAAAATARAARTRTQTRMATMTTAASSALPETPLAQPFAAVARARFSNGHYKEHQPVPQHVLAEVLKLAQRAPSSFNIQPYSLVVVRDPAVRARLAKEAMLGACCGCACLSSSVCLSAAACRRATYTRPNPPLLTNHTKPTSPPPPNTPHPTGSNGAKVLSAPVTVVVAADLESARTMPRVVALLRKAGAFPEAFLAKVGKRIQTRKR